MFSLILILLLATLGLGVFLWGATAFFQGYVYTESAPDLYWRAPAAAGALGLFLAFWCILDYNSIVTPRDYGDYDVLFSFSTREDKDFKRFWSRKRLAGGKLGPQVPYTLNRRGEWVNARGEPWRLQDFQGIAGEVTLELDGHKVAFRPELTRRGAFKKNDQGEVYFVEEDGDGRVLTETELERGSLPVYHAGLFWANFLLNLFYLVLWFGCLWLLLRFQWPHAAGLALALWLATVIPGSVVSMLLAQTRAVAQEAAQEKPEKEAAAPRTLALLAASRPRGGS